MPADYYFKVKNKICEYSRQIIMVFFVILLAFGIIAAPSYGVNYDFESEEYILMTNLKEIAVHIAPKSVDKVHTFSDIPVISEYKEKDHGKAVFYPIGALKLAIKPSADTYYKCYHIYTFLINYIGIVFLYFTAKFLFKRRRYALLAVLLFIFNPRIFADCFYNDKDMVFCSLLVITAFFAYKTIENNNKIIYPIMLGISSAFACNIRIIGLFLPLISLLVYTWNIIKNKSYKNIKSFIAPFTAMSVCAVVFILITPATWNGLVDYFKYTFQNSADFTRWNGTVYYLGRYYDLTTVNLPWHYLPVTIFVTTPLLISAFFILGLIMLIKNKGNKYMAILFCSSFFPVLFAILNKSRLYNGWRHFYFIYPAIVLIGVYGIKEVFKNRNLKFKKCISAVLCLFIITGAIRLFVFSNHGYSYYSLFPDKFEGDYWNISSAECMENLLEDKEGKIKIIGSDFHSSSGLYYAVKYLSEEMRERVTICENKDEADYIFTNPTYLDIAKNTHSEYINTCGFVPVSEIKTRQRTLMTVYSKVTE